MNSIYNRLITMSAYKEIDVTTLMRVIDLRVSSYKGRFCVRFEIRFVCLFVCFVDGDSENVGW